MPASEIFDDEIDLKALARTLLRAKFWIVSLTAFALIAGYAVSKLFLPQTYQATAYVVIAKPLFTANLDERIQQASQTLDSKTLTDLSRSDDIILDLMQFFTQSGALDEDITLNAFESRLEAKLVGTTQLSLIVTDTDPELAAAVANAWAERAAARLNTLFDLDADSLSQMKQQVTTARQNWDAAEQTLLAQIPLSQVETLAIVLSQDRELLKDYLARIGALDSLLTDARALQERLGGQAGDQAVARLYPQGSQRLLPGDALSLILLQQHMIMNAGQLQVDFVLSESLAEGYTVDIALESLAALVQASDNQRSDLQAMADALMTKIITTAAALETAQYEMTQRSVERDLALDAYQALSSQVEETGILLAQGNQTAKIAGRALPPQRASGPRSSMNALIAAAAAFVLTVFAVLVLEWWKSPDMLKSSPKA